MPHNLEMNLTRNAEWIERQIASGKTFYTIGRDLTRAEPSSFYNLELDILKLHGIEPIPIPRP